MKLKLTRKWYSCNVKPSVRRRSIVVSELFSIILTAIGLLMLEKDEESPDEINDDEDEVVIILTGVLLIYLLLKSGIE